jgi:hypothetical protein
MRCTVSMSTPLESRAEMNVRLKSCGATGGTPPLEHPVEQRPLAAASSRQPVRERRQRAGVREELASLVALAEDQVPIPMR